MIWLELILGYVAELKWPAVLLFLLWRNKSHLPELLERLGSFELPGGIKGTLAEPLAKLEESAAELGGTIAEIPPEVEAPVQGATARVREVRDTASVSLSDEAPRQSTTAAELEFEDSYDTERRVLEAAKLSPSLALMTLSAEIERETRQIAASRGVYRLSRSGKPVKGARMAITELAKSGILPESAARALDAFWSVRNAIVHGRRANQEEELQALDSGIDIYKSLHSVPREIHRVFFPRVEIYSDPAGLARRDDCWGVGIGSRGNERPYSIRVFPTTRNYEAGQFVSWDWGEKAIGESWFRNPETENIEYAWTQALEFIGRDIGDIF